MPAALETIVARDLADMAATAGDIGLDLRWVEKYLGEAYEGDRDEAQAVAAALRLLRGMPERVVALVREIEGYR